MRYGQSAFWAHGSDLTGTDPLEIRRQLAAIGNNINQIARAVNARSFATKEDIIGQAYTYDSFLMLLRRNGVDGGFKHAEGFAKIGRAHV